MAHELSELARLRKKRHKELYPGRLFHWGLARRAVEVHVVPCVVRRLPEKVSSLVNPAVLPDGWARSVLNSEGWASGGTANSVDTLITQMGGKALSRELDRRRMQREWLIWAWKMVGKGMMSDSVPTALFGKGVSTVDTAICTSNAHGELDQYFHRLVHATPPAYEMPAERWIERMLTYYRLSLQAAFRPGVEIGSRLDPADMQPIDAQKGQAKPSVTIVAVPVIGPGACGAPMEVASRTVARAALMWLRAGMKTLRHPGAAQARAEAESSSPNWTMLIATTDVRAHRAPSRNTDGASAQQHRARSEGIGLCRAAARAPVVLCLPSSTAPPCRTLFAYDWFLPPSVCLCDRREQENSSPQCSRRLLATRQHSWWTLARRRRPGAVSRPSRPRSFFGAMTSANTSEVTSCGTEEAHADAHGATRRSGLFEGPPAQCTVVLCVRGEDTVHVYVLRLTSLQRYIRLSSMIEDLPSC